MIEKRNTYSPSRPLDVSECSAEIVRLNRKLLAVLNNSPCGIGAVKDYYSHCKQVQLNGKEEHIRGEFEIYMPVHNPQGMEIHVTAISVRLYRNNSIEEQLLPEFKDSKEAKSLCSMIKKFLCVTAP